MPRTSTTFKKGEVNARKPKGSKHLKTQIKEQLGLTQTNHWKEVGSYLEGEGAIKLIQEINKLRGKAYVMAWQTAVEFFKPKVLRQIIEDSRPQQPTFTNVFNVLSLEQKAQLLELLRSAGNISVTEQVREDKKHLPPSAPTFSI